MTSQEIWCWTPVRCGAAARENEALHFDLTESMKHLAKLGVTSETTGGPTSDFETAR
jgi:hypothetical protein